MLRLSVLRCLATSGILDVQAKLTLSGCFLHLLVWRSFSSPLCFLNRSIWRGVCGEATREIREMAEQSGPTPGALSLWRLHAFLDMQDNRWKGKMWQYTQMHTLTHSRRPPPPTHTHTHTVVRACACMLTRLGRKKNSFELYATHAVVWHDELFCESRIFRVHFIFVCGGFRRK